MKYIRKSTAIILILTVFLVFTLSSVIPDKASAQNGIIHETSKTQILTSGATLETKVRFTDYGWQTINIVRVDLTNPNIAVDTLINQESNINLTTVKNLAQSSGAIAAVNANFFIWEPDKSKGRPIGPVIQSGQVVSEDTGVNTKVQNGVKTAVNEWGTFSIDNLNQCFLDFWRLSIKLTAPNGNSVEVGRYNQPYHGHLDFSIIDSKMRKTTIGNTSGSYDTVEMLVSNGKVVEIRQKMPETAMPENGYIVVTRTEGSKFLLDNFKVGDDVSVTFSSNPDWSDKKLALSGGAVLLKDGVIPAKFSHIASSGKDPRTAIGSSKDGKHLFLVTVDGKSSMSIGMTQTELAQFMKEIGAYNALNLDGGGSTTMVARQAGSTSVDLINDPSDGSQRKISTAVGVFSIAPKSELKGLIFENNEGNVFVNTSRTYKVKGYDTFFNPVEVDPAAVKWSVSGITGTFEGNVFRPTSVGTGKIKATVGNISQETAVYSLSAPVQLKLSDSSLNIAAGKTKTIYVTGKNSSGYYATISPSDVKWTVSSDFGSFNGGIFKAERYGSGYIAAQIGNTRAYCKTSVKDGGSIIDTFEAANATIFPYPDIVTASYQISNEQAHAGSFSGKLTYNFPESTVSRAAYIEYQNQGLPLSSNTTKLGMWVYNDHENSNCLGAQVYDTSGKLNYVYFTKGMNWSGWKYLEASLKDVKSPARVAKLYLTQLTPVGDAGSIYLDSLSTVTSGGGYPAVNQASIPKDTEPVDDANKYVPFTKTSASFRFAVFGQASEPRNALEKLLLTKFTSKINSLLDFSAVVGSSKHAFFNNIKKPKLATGSGYKSTDYQNSRFIQLDMSKGSLRKTDPAQWHWFLKQLNSARSSNVFILLANSPQNFKDSHEAELFQDYLTQYKLSTKKNVWVFYNGSTNTSYMEKGIKYISSAGFNVSGLKPENTDIVKYAIVTVIGNNVTYQFRPISP